MFKQKKQKNTAAENRLGANQKIGILFCAMVSAVATGYVPNYINLYYTDAVGISMGAVAMILMITKITDGVTDIIMGMIIDRTHTRLGKARPWVLAGGIGIAVSIMLLFNCPGNLSYTGKVAFCAGCYFLANPFFGTMVSVACGTLNNLLTSDSRQRGVLGVFSAYGSLIPVLMIGLVVPKILSAMNESQEAYTTATLVFAVMAVLACVIGVLCTRETVTENSKDQLKENQTVKESIKALIKNKYFIYLAIGTILYNLSAAPVANLLRKICISGCGGCDNHQPSGHADGIPAPVCSADDQPCGQAKLRGIWDGNCSNQPSDHLICKQQSCYIHGWKNHRKCGGDPIYGSPDSDDRGNL